MIDTLLNFQYDGCEYAFIEDKFDETDVHLMLMADKPHLFMIDAGIPKSEISVQMGQLIVRSYLKGLEYGLRKAREAMQRAEQDNQHNRIFHDIVKTRSD